MVTLFCFMYCSRKTVTPVRFEIRMIHEQAALGWMPILDDLDISGLDGFDREQLEKVFEIDLEEWKTEVNLQDEFFLLLHRDLPEEIILQKELLVSRLF